MPSPKIALRMPPPRGRVRARRLLLMDALVNGFQELLFFSFGKFLCVLGSEVSIEFLSQNISKRFASGPNVSHHPCNNFPSDRTGVFVLRSEERRGDIGGSSSWVFFC